MQRLETPAPPLTGNEVSAPARLMYCGRIVFWATICITLGSWFLVTLAWPFGRDQGILAWAGDVVLKGGMPYRDAWEVKGPTAILPYSLVEFIFGHNMWGIRVFDLVLTAANLSALYVICRGWWDATAGRYALLIGAFAAVTMDFWVTAQPDGWCAYFIALAIAFLGGAVRPVSNLRFAAAGLLLSLCVLQKPLYLIYLALLLPPLVWKWRERVFWQAVGASAAAFLAPLAVTLAWFAARHALPSLIETYLLYNVRTHAQIQVYSPIEQLTAFVNWLRCAAPFSTFLLPALLGGAILLRLGKLPAALFWFWLFLGLAFVIVQRKYDTYHWFPLFPWLAAGTAIALRQGKEMPLLVPRSWKIELSASHLALLCFAGLYLLLPVHYIRDWVSYRIGLTSRAQYESTFVFDSKNYFWFRRIAAIAGYLHSRTTPDQSVLVWGFDAGINYLSERQSPSRFGYAYPLEVGPDTPYHAAYRAEFLDKLRANPPEYVVVADRDENLLIKDSSKQEFEAFRELSDFVHKNYSLEPQVYGWDLWRRND